MGQLTINDKRLASHRLTPEDMTELLKTIDHLPSYVGATPFTEDPTPIIALANFILKRFPSIRSKTLVDAFEMGAAGDLYGDGKRLSVKSYGRPLSIDLVGEILRAYVEWQRTEQSRPKMVIPQSHQLGAADTRATPEDLFNALLSEVKQTGILPEFYAYKLAYDHLVTTNEIKPIEVKPKKHYRGVVRALAETLRTHPERDAVAKWLIDQGHLININKNENQIN
jgi:hypothetical protein